MTDRLKDEESSEGRREMAHIRVLFCEYPGAEMKHNSTWSTLKDAQKRARELQDKGFGTEIKPSGSLPSSVGADIIKQVDDPEPCGKRLYDADDGEKLNCGKPKGHSGEHYPWPELETKEVYRITPTEFCPECGSVYCGHGAQEYLPLVIFCAEHGLLFGPPVKSNIEVWKRHLETHAKSAS